MSRLSFIAIILGSLLAALGLVISIMDMNFTVAVGTINGFIFYFHCTLFPFSLVLLLSVGIPFVSLILLGIRSQLQYWLYMLTVNVEILALH